jgi:hypothetical protein
MYETAEVTKENVLSELLQGSALVLRKCRKRCNPDGFLYKRLRGRHRRQRSQKEGVGGREYSSRVISQEILCVLCGERF